MKPARAKIAAAAITKFLMVVSIVASRFRDRFTWEQTVASDRSSAAIAGLGPVAQEGCCFDPLLPMSLDFPKAV